MASPHPPPARTSLAKESLTRGLQAGLLCVAMTVMLGAGGTDMESRVERMGHEMICMCGCSQILLECNHVGCPVSPVMIRELHEQITAGGSDKTILSWFAKKYGAVAMAAPIRGGFDDVAWIMPIAVFVLATLGTAAVVWLWRRRSLRMAEAARGYGCGGVLDYDASACPAAPEPGAETMRERIRRETEYR